MKAWEYAVMHDKRAIISLSIIYKNKRNSTNFLSSAEAFSCDLRRRFRSDLQASGFW